MRAKLTAAAAALLVLVLPGCAPTHVADGDREALSARLPPTIGGLRRIEPPPEGAPPGIVTYEPLPSRPGVRATVMPGALLAGRRALITDPTDPAFDQHLFELNVGAVAGTRMTARDEGRALAVGLPGGRPLVRCLVFDTNTAEQPRVLVSCFGIARRQFFAPTYAGWATPGAVEDGLFFALSALQSLRGGVPPTPGEMVVTPMRR
jgi:hypothetical protein